MIQDRAIVTIEHQYEVIGSLSNGDIFNDLHRPGFHGHGIFEVKISEKRCILRTKLL